jgi:hypothetical protein
MAAKPTDGRNRSTRQVTKSATRRGRELDAEDDWDTTGTLAAAKIGCNGGAYLELFQADITVATEEEK